MADDRPNDQPNDEARSAVADLRLAVRIGWIAVRLIAVFYLGQQGAMFLYQGF